MIREAASHLDTGLAARVLGLLLLADSAAAQWPQWGGPERDFRSPATDLADAWPETGPKRLWERELGPGYSSIVSDGARLFTLALRAEEETVVALDAKSGATVWEHPLRAVAGNEPPNSTPILVGDGLFALGFAGHLCALDKASGKLLWSRDLLAEFKAKQPMYGFAASPLATRDALIVPAGGKGFGVAAFALADGKLLWRAQDFEELYASPILVEVDGETQVAVLTPDRIAGLDPASGALLWSEPIVNEGGQNIATPLWGARQQLYVTSGTYGTVALKLSKQEGKTRVEQVWKNDKQIAQSTVVEIGDYLFGSTGGETNYLIAIHAGTGAVAWQDERFSGVNLVAADGKLVLFDGDGVLALGTPSPTGLKAHSKATVLEPQTFTPPTLDGRTLYVRDLKHLKAFDLGQPD